MAVWWRMREVGVHSDSLWCQRVQVDSVNQPILMIEGNQRQVDFAAVSDAERSCSRSVASCADRQTAVGHFQAALTLLFFAPQTLG